MTTVLTGWKIGPHSWFNGDSQFAIAMQTSGSSGSIFSIYVADAGGTASEILRGESGSVWSSPAVARGSATLAAKRSTNSQFMYNLGDVWLANSDGTNLRLLHSPAVSDFAWSPDERQLVVSGGQPDCACGSEEKGVYLLRVSDGSFRKLMDVNAFRVDWSQ